MTSDISFTTDWVNIEIISEEYNLDLHTIAAAFEEKEIKTRGCGFDDKEGYSGFKPINIPVECWSRFILGEYIAGNSNRCFLFEYQYVRDQSSRIVDEIRYGYLDIQVSRKDFQKKLKPEANGKIKRNRIHPQIRAIESIYNELSNSGEMWVSPKMALNHVIDNYDIQTGDENRTKNFAIEDLQLNDDDPKSKFFYSIEGGPLKHMVFGRFYTLISEFNNKHNLKPS